MSFLWNGRKQCNCKPKQIKQPSPIHQKRKPGSAQVPANPVYGSICRSFPLNRTIEKTLFPAFLRRKAEAGMTVEAAVILPLFLFFVLNLGCALELIRLHGRLQLALWETGSKLAVYGYALEDSSVALFFSDFYVRGQVVNYVGEEYLNHSPVQNGAKGLMPWESESFTSGDKIDLILTYQAGPLSEYAGFASFRMANRYYAHLWNGYDVTGPHDETAEEMVYVAENGQVYHNDRSCTHLSLSIQETSRAEAIQAVNQWGKSYSPCEICRPGETVQTLYITNEGDRYHSDRSCSGLKRTVYAVLKRQVPGYRPCSRCGQGRP